MDTLPKCAAPLLALLGACATGAPPAGNEEALRVDVRTDFVPGLEFVRVVALGDGVEQGAVRARFGDDFSTFRRVALLRSGARRVRVELRDEDEAPVGSAEADVPAGHTSIRLTVFRHPESRCTRLVDCPRDPACAPPRCEGGRCFAPPDHGRCDSGLCDPVAGCVSDVPDEDGDGLPLTEDCDDANPSVGSEASRPCDDVRCGPGSGTERCTSGSWGACEASCACSPGETQSETCGNCGTRVDVCEEGSFTPGRCVGEGPCAPGETQTGDPCGRCGVQQRSCSPTCGWSDWRCVEPPSGCWLWRWDPAGGWQGYTMPEAASPLAPSAPILAAFDVEERAEAWLLTASTYHVLQLGDLSWVAAGDLIGPASPFPGFTGTPVGAFNISASRSGGPEQAIVAVEGELAFVYEVLDVDARTWRLVSTAEPPRDDPFWTSPGAPAWTAIQAGWFARDNPNGWVTRLPSGCGAQLADVTYQVILSATHAHVYVAGCGFLDTPLPLAGFGPFTTPNGPPTNTLGATFYRERSGHLWAITP